MTAAEVGIRAEPERRVGARFRIGFGLMSFGLLAALLTPLQILLPLQTAVFGGEGKANILALVSSVGGVAGILAAPLVGMISDRTRSRFGRRRPWVLASGAIGMLGLVGLAFAPNIAMLLVTFSVLQIGIGGLVATTLVLVADQVPVAQRGEISGLFGIAGALSPVFGAWSISFLGGDIAGGYLVLAGLMAAGTVLLVATVRDPSSLAATVRPWDWRELVACFRLNPRRDPDLAWAWLTRFLVFLGMALSLGFILYWTQQVLGHSNADTAATADRMAVSTSIYAAVMVVSALVAGIISDRLRRRKIFVVVATLGLALCTVANLIWPNWTAILVVSATTGLAFGVYSTMDLAVAAEVLPRADELARDMGVLQSANTFPSLAGPALGAVILTGAGFTGLFIASALCMVAAAFTITRIRSVR